MTAAEDCRVAAGCGSCALGRAGICGDPGTQIPAGFGLVAAYVLAGQPRPDNLTALAEAVGDPIDTDAPDVPDAEEPKPEGAGCCDGACTA